MLTSALPQATAQTILDLEHHPQLAATLARHEAAFLAHDLQTGMTVMLRGSDVDTRHPPWSTFKIPNTLLALHTGAIGDPRQVHPWDQSRYPPQSWWPERWRQDHSLETAFQHSAVSFYRQIAADIGARVYQSALSAWSYGNAEAPDGNTGFWLGGPLAISVREQVAFLERLAAGRLGVTSDDTDVFYALSEDMRVGDATVHAKTGAGRMRDGSQGWEGWYVGLVRRSDSAPVAFAFYMQAQSWSGLRDARREPATHLLTVAGLLPGLP